MNDEGERVALLRHEFHGRLDGWESLTHHVNLRATAVTERPVMALVEKMGPPRRRRNGVGDVLKPGELAHAVIGMPECR